MSPEQSKLEQLKAFMQRDKFSDQAWNNRGLNPSDPEISSTLKLLLDECAGSLIEAINTNANDKQIKTILKSHLSNINKQEYDTEEKEFICDLFNELTQIINIDFKDNLNKWLYGSAISTLLKLQSTLNPKRVLETIHQTCPTCNAAIDTFIMRKEEGIPDYSWIIVQCDNCKDYTIISYGPNIKETKSGNYKLIEQLPKDQFTQEQAEIRLEQIRYFRK